MNQSKMRQILLVAAVAVGCVTAAGTAYAEVKGWDSGKGSSKPTMKQLVPTMSSDESYTERYTFSANLDGGGHIGTDFTISNLGWGDGAGAVQVRVKYPGQKKYKFSKKVDDDEWTYSKKTFKLDIADTKVTALGKGKFRIQHDGSVKLDVVYDNTIPAWKPGDGRIDTEEGYYKFNLIAPRANVSGKVYIGGKWRKIKATKKGYADHVATNAAPFDLAKRFMRMRDYNKDVFIIWREIRTTDDLGGKSMTWVMVGYKDKIVFSDPSARLKFARVRKDSRGGYDFPMDIQVDGQSGEDTVKLVMRGTKYRRTDLLDRLAPEAKIVAAAVSKPFRYEIKCKYTLQLDIQGAKATVGGDWHFVLDYINR